MAHVYFDVCTLKAWRDILQVALREILLHCGKYLFLDFSNYFRQVDGSSSVLSDVMHIYAHVYLHELLGK